MEIMDKGLTAPKWLLIYQPKIPKMPQILSAQIFYPSPKSLDFDEKRHQASLIVHSPCIYTSTISTNFNLKITFVRVLNHILHSLWMSIGSHFSTDFDNSGHIRVPCFAALLLLRTVRLHTLYYVDSSCSNACVRNFHLFSYLFFGFFGSWWFMLLCNGFKYLVSDCLFCLGDGSLY